VIATQMSAIMIAVNMPGRVTHAAPAEHAVQARFLERLPAKLRGAVLYAVSAEDHYLRLHTSKGSDLILMRLADAIGELEGLEGAQTHRSWWVAREAVESARREGERIVLVLKGGTEAPVSRPNLRPLREAGWF
jgi:DNA-binding LytR/AlgR family response regulator